MPKWLIIIFSLYFAQIVFGADLVCPKGFIKDKYGAMCIHSHCPEGFVVDFTQPSGCALLPVHGACGMNCKTWVNKAAPEGRNCPPCQICPKNHLQTCDYHGNKCKCRDLPKLHSAS